MFCLFSRAQKNDSPALPEYKGECKALFPHTTLNAVNTDNVKQYLQTTIENLQQEGCALKLQYINQSPGGVHYSFLQTYYGVEVYQSEIKINLSKTGSVRSVFDNSCNTKHWNLDMAGAGNNSVILLHPEIGKPVIANHQVRNHIEVLETNGEIIYQRDTRSYSGADSTVTGTIFNPDPLTTAQQPYTPGTFDDNGDANSTWLNNQLVSVSFPANFTGTEFKLENSFVKLVDVDSPNVLPAVSSLPQFNFNRSQTGFEDVNAFYHLNQYRNQVNSLGFSLANQLVLVDAHAWSGNDQSSFTPNGGNPELDFGVGGVDDAEDADVLIHEYAHFVSYNAAPGSNVGSQRNSLDEAFGDYAAASYSASLSSYNKEWVFNWDGPVWSNNNFGGRTVASSKVYPTDITGSIYKNAPIWSTALMNIHNEIGRLATDSLIYQAHYSYAANISMDDAAQLLIDADTLLNNGAYYCPIYKHLLQRGLVPFYANNPCGISGINEAEALPVNFFQNNMGFTITQQNELPLSIRLYAITGELLAVYDINQSTYTYTNANLANGVYLVQAKAEQASKTFKWVKNY